MKRLLLIGLLLAVLGAFQVAPAPAQAPTPYSPTNGWRTSTPEAQGMDSQLLAAMLTAIHDQDINIHSVLVIRNGYLVTEAYLYPYDESTLHELRSATKSFTSALIGIAMARGYLDGVDAPILDFFPERTIANLDDAKRAITLQDLLTMSSGLDWPGGMREPLFDSMSQSQDWVQFVLDRPLADQPGSTFVYNSGGSHLLAAILEQSTGTSALEFARQNLFEPLGFGEVNWRTDAHGTVIGSTGLSLTPRDMAKFGTLYLNGGQWDGQVIIPAWWVAASTRQQVAAGPLSDGYGYQWWVDRQGYYMALGYGGQDIIVQPENNLVVVFTSGLPAASEFPEELLNTYILPAVQASEPLPENPDGAAALQAAEALSQPDPARVPELPETAQRISGKTYRLAENATGWKAFSLTFAQGDAVALLTVDGSTPVPIGLDNAYRGSILPPQIGGTASNTRIMGRGAWRTATRFACDVQIMASPENRIQIEMDFEGENVAVHAVGLGPQPVELSGTAQQ